MYGLPGAETGALVERGQSEADIFLDAANNFNESSRGDETIFLDGETYVATLRLRYGIAERWSVGVDLPYISHEGGGLDDFIEDWHDLWGLPNNDREDFAQDRLLIRYQRAGQTQVLLERQTEGLGDVRIGAAYQLQTEPGRHIALRGGVQLPTGEEDDLLGSGSTDIYLGADLTDTSWLAGHGVTVNAGAGVLWIENDGLLARYRNDWVAYGSAGVSWAFSPSLALKAQLDAHSAVYDSDLRDLGSASAQLLLGGSVRLSRQWLMDIAVIEDIAVNTAPDVVFQLALRWAR